ncbi:AraC family transcriptional regulator [Actinobacteria bacterium YIM 96077]|uniref:AraC family transcriptional regulator n=2 Tax=Phytoactinopolyspora halophila TaxID=1981511 RepID=A0A329QJS5_9ACTN|nr:AraC family transcriptional regulator [Actinobacteria bacterium YIM 96077]RAW11949.1 AraC family transcriptional regulator [Phytoactinopolyspora halophila]
MPGTAAVETLVAVRRARDLIDRSYAERLDLDQIANAAGYSRYHFTRAFRAAYGETPGQYLSRRRIERAQDLLRSVNLTVTEVCHLVGFASLGSFSSLFTKLSGMPPSEFQRRARASGPPPIPGCYLLAGGGPAQRTAATHPEVSGRPETSGEPAGEATFQRGDDQPGAEVRQHTWRSSSRPGVASVDFDLRESVKMTIPSGEE